jgi:signal transduction histidine kinase
VKFSEFKRNIDAGLKASLATEETSERVKNLEAILNILNTINRTLILDDVLDLVLKNAIRITNSERGFIVLKNESEQLEYKLGLDSENNELPEDSFNISNTVVDDVFLTGQSIFLEGAQSDTDYDPSKSILRLELQTILCSPLITNGKKIGVIYVDSKYLQKIKIREITGTFEILAGQAAAAIRNAQLYNGQVASNIALQEANAQLIQAERKTLKSTIDAEIGQSLQSLVHLALLETESLMRTIEKAQKENQGNDNPLIYDRLKLKSKVAIDSISNIQKFAQVLLETSLLNLNKDSEDINRTIQSVIKYLAPMKKFYMVTFNAELNKLPKCPFDSEQIQHLFVHLVTNSAEAKKDANIVIRSKVEENKIVLEVEDDGPGFPDKILENPFKSSVERKGSYGLYLCKSIVDRHNGEMELSNTKTGASVKIYLPVYV